MNHELSHDGNPVPLPTSPAISITREQAFESIQLEIADLQYFLSIEELPIDEKIDMTFLSIRCLAKIISKVK